MRKVYILYYNFFDYNGYKLTIGGIQTYIRNLCDLIIQRNEEPIIVQYANNEFVRDYNGIKVYGIRTQHKKNNKDKVKILYSFTKSKLIIENDIIIFASDTMNISCDHDKVISIQHGICWDIPMRGRMNRIYPHLDVYMKAKRARNHLINLEKIPNLVCVDYNFLNWYRTQVAKISINCTIIPNSVVVPEVIKEKNSVCELIFARRFEIYRGTDLIIEVIRELNKKKVAFNITLAGEGSQEKYLKKELQPYSNVKFISYKPEDSINIHKKYDIALIPTIGSEGTSLSLLEAMASKCATIASNVGGMTNVIINNYNGYLVNPEAENFVNKIEYLIQNRDEIDRISKCGYETVKRSFNISIWKDSWNNEINRVLRQRG